MNTGEIYSSHTSNNPLLGSFGQYSSPLSKEFTGPKKVPPDHSYNMIWGARAQNSVPRGSPPRFSPLPWAFQGWAILQLGTPSGLQDSPGAADCRWHKGAWTVGLRCPHACSWDPSKCEMQFKVVREWGGQQDEDWNGTQQGLKIIYLNLTF